MFTDDLNDVDHFVEHILFFFIVVLILIKIDDNGALVEDCMG